MQVDVSVVAEAEGVPETSTFKPWVQAALDAADAKPGDVAIRIVDKAEMQQLNRDYRHQDKPTNVLSFPFEMPAGIDDIDLIHGDLAICAAVVTEEAAAQHKSLVSHWAHMVVHGTLHLLGYDHIKDDEAEIMEGLEIRIMEQLGFNNPYRSH